MKTNTITTISASLNNIRNTHVYARSQYRISSRILEGDPLRMKLQTGIIVTKNREADRLVVTFETPQLAKSVSKGVSVAGTPHAARGKAAPDPDAAIPLDLIHEMEICDPPSWPKHITRNPDLHD